MTTGLPSTGSAPSSRKQLTHGRILDTAARVLRESGFGGVGVADIMKRAGLTHGGFYAHFPSRDALLAEALDHADRESHARLERSVARRESASGGRFRAMVESHLADRHLKSPGSGCPLAALASELPRQSAAVRLVGVTCIESFTSSVEAALCAVHRGEAAAVIAAQLLGALQIARTLGDKARGRRHLAASRRFLLEQFEKPRRAKRAAETPHALLRCWPSV